MSKFTAFIVFNGLVYFIYLMIDKVFTFFDWYSNPLLGTDLNVMPTDGDIKLIIINSILSSIISFMILRQIKDGLD